LWRPAVLFSATVAVAAAGVGVAIGQSAASPTRPATTPGSAARNAAALSTGSGPATVTVVGSGTVTGTPDTLTLSMGVSARAPSATVALDTSSNELQALQRVFIHSGVPAKDLQTSFLQLQPNYSNSGKVTGYEADNQLTITLHPIAKAGEVIDAAAHAVGNDVRIDGISFSISNTTPLLARARAQAVQQAAADAAQLAAAAGTTLGPIVSITDQTGPSGPSGASGLQYASASGAPARVPVETGTEQVNAEVQIVYQLGS
jgi:uncharacterized protein YggE